MKKMPKILKIMFAIIFLFQIAGVLFLILSSPVLADEEKGKIIFEPQVAIPGVERHVFNENDTTAEIGNYIVAIYKYSIGIVGILAAVVLMWGGLVWLTAGGNSSRIEDSKAWIGAALTGMVLMLGSYTILNIINPDLVNFRTTTISKTEPPEKIFGQTFNKTICSWKVVGSRDSTNDCSVLGMLDGYNCEGSPSIADRQRSKLLCCCDVKDFILSGSQACRDLMDEKNIISYTKVSEKTPIPASCNTYDFNGYGISEKILKALAATESTCNPNANSGHACGLMQLTPATAGETCEWLINNPQESIAIAAEYIKNNEISHKNNLNHIFAGYNSGYSLGINPITEKRGGLAASKDCPGVKAYECCINPGGLEETQDHVYKSKKYYNSL